MSGTDIPYSATRMVEIPQHFVEALKPTTHLGRYFSFFPLFSQFFLHFFLRAVLQRSATLLLKFPPRQTQQQQEKISSVAFFGDARAYGQDSVHVHARALQGGKLERGRLPPY